MVHLLCHLVHDQNEYFTFYKIQHLEYSCAKSSLLVSKLAFRILTVV